jgi:prepilin-type processing-associated H-X9-DG protein
LYKCLESQPCAADDCEHESFGIGSSTPTYLLCPTAELLVSADPNDRSLKMDAYALQNLSKGNYAANFGANTYVSFLDKKLAGPFGIVRLPGTEKVTQTEGHSSMWGTWKIGLGIGTRQKQIKDGSSNTLAISELLGYRSPDDGRGAWVWPGMGGSTFVARYAPNSPEKDQTAACDLRIPPNDPLRCTQNRSNGDLWASARSRHTGGVNAALMDGSTRFFNDSIDITVWQAMATMAGSEPFTMPQ